MTEKSLVLLGGAHVHLPDHLTHLKQRDWQISHVHDRDPDRQRRLTEDLNARPVAPDQLSGLNCRGAIVCSETTHHEADILAALNAGLPVFTEKPMASSSAAAQRCADAAERKGLTLQTGYFFRTNAALRRLHATIQDGSIGRISEARMRFSHDGGYADWLDLDCWMTDPQLACFGGFTDEGVHAIDALQWMLGPIETACAVTGNVLGWPVDDHGAAAVTFKGGATGVIQAGWTDSAMRLELDIVGETGWARLRAGSLAVGRRGSTDPEWTVALSPLDAGEGIEPFLDTLEGREPTGLVPPRDAVQVNTVLDLMNLRVG